MRKQAPTDTYYLRDRGKIVGQFTLEDLAELKSQGRFSRFSRVSADKSRWVSYEEFVGGQVVDEEIPSLPPRQTDRQPEFKILTAFPVAVLLYLHYTTVGVFSFFWITGMHGRLPRLESHHPSGGRAIVMALIPFVNLYWIFLCYPGLADRLNTLLDKYGIRSRIPVPLVILSCIFVALPVLLTCAGLVVIGVLVSKNSPIDQTLLVFVLIPNVLTIVNLFIVIPVLSGMFQSSYNKISGAQLRRLLQKVDSV